METNEKCSNIYRLDNSKMLNKFPAYFILFKRKKLTNLSLSTTGEDTLKETILC